MWWTKHSLFLIFSIGLGVAALNPMKNEANLTAISPITLKILRN
jgi:hypothetical protein